MAAKKEFSENDLGFIEYLRDETYLDREAVFNAMLARHGEITGSGSVSPKTYQQLFEEHLDPVIESRTYLAGELNEVLTQFKSLEGTPQGASKGILLKRMSDTTTVAKDKYQDFMKRIMGIIVECTPRVYWRKHHKNNAQEELADWLMVKHLHMGDLIADKRNYAVKSELELVQDALAGAIGIGRPATATGSETTTRPQTSLITPPTTVGRKRPRDDDDVGLKTIKKLKLDGGEEEVFVADWWGPNNSKLNCDPAFFGVIRDFKTYMADPEFPPGTRKYRLAMVGFLRQALDATGLRQHLNQLLLRHEWCFRDPKLAHVRTPAFVTPGVSESEARLGRMGCRGSNDFKRMLGGGLTPEELSPRNLEPDFYQGMVSLAHSRHHDEGLSLRGGGGDDDDTTGAKVDDSKKREQTRKMMKPRFRDPAELWAELWEDATFPKGGYSQRRNRYRPPMVEPDRMGKALEYFKGEMTNVDFREFEYEKVQVEDDPEILEKQEERYFEDMTRSRAKYNKFIYKNETHIVSTAPKLLEPGGTESRKRRYPDVREISFAKPARYVFEARAYQVLRLGITWKLYLMGIRTLEDLLGQERELLDVWGEHEDLYMEWENFKYFSLSSKYELEELRQRYKVRSVMRARWEEEKNQLNQAILNLMSNPHHYDLPEGTDLSLSPDPSPREPRQITTPVRTQSIILNPTGQTPNLQLPTPKSHEIPNLDIMDVDTSDADTQTVGGANDTWATVDTQTKYAPKDGKDGTCDVRFLQGTLEAYRKRLDEIRAENAALDAGDPGNHAVINRNNVDIMAKQEVIWCLDTELHNRRRAVDPFDKVNQGLGARYKWELPEPEEYMQNITLVPKNELALGIESFGLGPLPGEHPPPDDPRVFFGGPPSFGRDANPDEEMGLHPVGSRLFDGGRPPPPHTVPRDIPQDWENFLDFHSQAWLETEPTGLAAMDWMEWIEAVCYAFTTSALNFKDVVLDFIVGGASSWDIEMHVRGLYRKRFGWNGDHKYMPWRERERRRQMVLETLAKQMNTALTRRGEKANFPVPEPLPPMPDEEEDEEEKTDASEQGAPETGLLRKLKKHLKLQYEAESTYERLRILRKNESTFTDSQREAMEKARVEKDSQAAIIRSMRRRALKNTSAQLEILQQEAKDKLKAEISQLEGRAQYSALGRKLQQQVDEENKQQSSPPTTKPVTTTTKPVTTTTKPATTAAPKTAKSSTFTDQLLQQAGISDDDGSSHPQTSSHPQAPEQPEQEDPQTKLIREAQEFASQASQRYSTAQASAAKADQDHQEALAAIKKRPSDSYLQQLETYAAQVKAKADEELAEAEALDRLYKTALASMQGLGEPAVTAKDLNRDYRAVIQDLNLWAYGFDWKDHALTPRRAIDEWLLDAITLMYESWRAAGVIGDAAYWRRMRDNFFQNPGTDFRKMRAVFMYSQMERLNHYMTSFGMIPYANTPPMPQVPPFPESPRTLSELLSDASAELSVPIPDHLKDEEDKTKVEVKPTTPGHVKTEPKPGHPEWATPTETKLPDTDWLGSSPWLGPWGDTFDELNTALGRLERYDDQKPAPTSSKAPKFQFPLSEPLTKPTAPTSTGASGFQFPLSAPLPPKPTAPATSPAVKTSTPTTTTTPANNPEWLRHQTHNPQPTGRFPRPDTSRFTLDVIKSIPATNLRNQLAQSTPKLPKTPTTGTTRTPTTAQPAPTTTSQPNPKTPKTPAPKPPQVTQATTLVTPRTTPATATTTSQTGPKPAADATAAAAVASEKYDAWPELNKLIKTTWVSMVAHEALAQRVGDKTGVHKGEGWPQPLWDQGKGNWVDL
ncbi:hypothetical protein F5Y10DRAFT_292323 [Nemania abortiva]|nr:hypothetical protein F5Y10DRAFT_292323 [Nemania abortiva]